jgi:hypothetical protein
MYGISFSNKEEDELQYSIKAQLRSSSAATHRELLFYYKNDTERADFTAHNL